MGESKDKGELPNDVMSEGMRGSLEEIFTGIQNMLIIIMMIMVLMFFFYFFIS